MNNDGGNRAIDLCLRARHADLDQPVRLWYGAGTLAQPVRVEAQSVRVIIPPLRGRTSGGIEHAPVASRSRRNRLRATGGGLRGRQRARPAQHVKKSAGLPVAGLGRCPIQ
jgi:hypothetical protein